MRSAVSPPAHHITFRSPSSPTSPLPRPTRPRARSRATVQTVRPAGIGWRWRNQWLQFWHNRRFVRYFFREFRQLFVSLRANSLFRWVPFVADSYGGLVGTGWRWQFRTTDALAIYEEPMPELPEVETMRRGIAGAVGGMIADVAECPCERKPILIRPKIAAFRRRVVGRSKSVV